MGKRRTHVEDPLRTPYFFVYGGADLAPGTGSSANIGIALLKAVPDVVQPLAFIFEVTGAGDGLFTARKKLG